MKVGHRPTGLQAAQAKMFVERFPSEFREMSMQKAVLPCSMDGLRPFVAPDGSLPCPALSTYNALRYLQGHPEVMAKADARAKAQMETIDLHERRASRVDRVRVASAVASARGVL